MPWYLVALVGRPFQVGRSRVGQAEDHQAGQSQAGREGARQAGRSQVGQEGGLPDPEESGNPGHLVAGHGTNNQRRLPWYLVRHRGEILVHPQIHRVQGSQLEESHLELGIPGQGIRQVGIQVRLDNLNLLK